MPGISWTERRSKESIGLLNELNTERQLIAKVALCSILVPSNWVSAGSLHWLSWKGLRRWNGMDRSLKDSGWMTGRRRLLTYNNWRRWQKIELETQHKKMVISSLQPSERKVDQWMNERTNRVMCDVYLLRRSRVSASGSSLIILSRRWRSIWVNIVLRTSINSANCHRTHNHRKRFTF